MTLACEGSATQALDATRCGSFDFARRLAPLRMTLACEGSVTQALDATRCGSFDCARRLASLRMTLHSVIRNPTTEPTGEPARAQRKRLTCRTHVLYWTEWRFLSRTTGRAGRRSAWCCRATSATAW